MAKRISISRYPVIGFALVGLVLVLFAGLLLLRPQILIPPGADRLGSTDSVRERMEVRREVHKALRITDVLRQQIHSRLRLLVQLEASNLALDLERMVLEEGSLPMSRAVKRLGESSEAPSGTDRSRPKIYSFIADPEGRVLSLDGAGEGNSSQLWKTPGGEAAALPLLRDLPSRSPWQGSIVSRERIPGYGGHVGALIPEGEIKTMVSRQLLRFWQDRDPVRGVSLFFLTDEGEVRCLGGNGVQQGDGKDPGGIGGALQASQSLEGGFITQAAEQGSDSAKQDRITFVKKHQQWDWVFWAVKERKGIIGSQAKAAATEALLRHRLPLFFFLLLFVTGTLIYVFWRFYHNLSHGLQKLGRELQSATADPDHRIGEDAFRFQELGSVASSANRMLQEHREAEGRMEWEKTYFEGLFQNAPDGMAIVDSEGMVRKVNKEFCTMFFFKEDEILDRDLAALIGNGDKLAEVREFTDKVLKGYTIYTESVRYRKDGQAIPVALYGVPTTAPSGETLVYGVFKDIREKKEAEDKLLRLTETDPLTGAYNRLKFDSILEEEIKLSQRYSDPFSLVMMDIDSFKRINDMFGHQAGDSVLKEIVSIIREIIRETDVFARIGGEEFMFLLRRTDSDLARRFAERMRREIAAYSFSVGRQVTCSFGVVTYREGDDFEILFNRVDTLLYSAKQRGRNRVVCEGKGP